MSIQLIIVIAYIVGLFALSIKAKKLAASGNSEGFLLAGRNFTTPIIAVSIIGLAIGGSSTIGVAENAFNVGLSAGWYNVAWGLAAIIAGLFTAEKYRKLNIATVPELFGRFYGKTAKTLMVASQVVILMTITALQYVAGGAILASLLPDIFTLQSGMIVSAVVFIGITFIGGMWSAGLANMLNVILIYLGITMAAVACIFKLGGMENIVMNLPQDVPYMSFIDGVGWAIALGWCAVMITQTQSLQAVVQISSSAKKPEHAKRGFIIGGLIMLPIGFLSALIGMAAKSVYPDISATMALPSIVMSLNPFLAGITLAALWAADVSTACNLLMGISTLFAQDIYKGIINPNVSEEKYTKVSKISIIVLGLLTFVLALTIVGILKTLTMALSLTTAFTLTFIMTVFFPKLCKKSSATATMITSIIVLVVWMIVPATNVVPHVIFLEWIVCSIVFLITCLVDKRPIDNIESALNLK